MWPLPNDPMSGAASALAARERGTRRARRGRALAAGVPPAGRGDRLPPRTVQRGLRQGVLRRLDPRFLGDDEAAARLGVDAVAIGQEHGYAYWTTYGAVWAATDKPGPPPDREFLDQILALLRLMGHQAFRASHLAFLARLDEAAGDADRADEHLAEAFAAARRSR